MSAKWLKAVLWLVCLVFFSVQSYNIFQQYGERATTMTIGQKVYLTAYMKLCPTRGL